MTMRRLAGVAALLIVLAVIPVIVTASPGFDDVPTSHTFYSDIEWLRDSGVTKGCNPPANTQFCPGDNVTRGQMAAFLHRLATDPRPQVVNIPGEAFNPVLDSDTIRLDDRFGATGLAGTHGLYAPVSLPDGATITKVECVFYDASASDLRCLLRWAPLDAVGVNSVGDADSSGSSGFQRVDAGSLSEPVVDNANRIYYVQAGPISGSWDGTDLGIKAMVITYTAPLMP